MIGGRVGTQIVEAHGSVRKEATIGGAAHEDEEASVARIVLDGVGKLRDDGLFAFKTLQEIPIFVEKHAGDADADVFLAGEIEHGFDFGDVEIFGGGTDVDDAEHCAHPVPAKYIPVERQELSDARTVGLRVTGEAAGGPDDGRRAGDAPPIGVMKEDRRTIGSKNRVQSTVMRVPAVVPFIS